MLKFPEHDHAFTYLMFAKITALDSIFKIEGK